MMEDPVMLGHAILILRMEYLHQRLYRLNYNQT